MKILIVEDDPDSRLVMQKTLEGYGYEVEAAVHGEDALVKAHASVPDLVISDILMPVMDGYKLCYAMKHDEKLRRVPLVFYTATYVDLEDERLAIGLGASRFVLKPLDPAEFIEIIREVIEEAARGELPVPDEPVDDALELFRKFDASLSCKLEDKVRELDLYRRFFEHSFEALVVLDRGGKITKANKAFVELLGFSESQLPGVSLEACLDEPSRVLVRQSLAETGKAQGEGRMRNRAGNEIPVWYATFPVKDEHNEIIAQVWVLQNISKRVEAEKKQRLFRTLVDYSNDAIFVINPETALIENVNERACNRLHYNMEELVGKTALDIDGQTKTMEQWRKVVAEIKELGVLTFESTHRRADGFEFPVEISVVYTETEDGDYLVSVARDIAERKKAEARLNMARQEWDRTFDAISDVVTVQDLEMRIIQANKAAGDLFNKPLSEIVGKHCYELFAPFETDVCPNCPVSRVRNNFLPHMEEVEHPALGKVFQVTMVPILDDVGAIKGVVHFAKDITEQKNLTAQLLQSQKMEAVGKLAGGVAHDFNNLLSVILGYAQMAQRRFSPDEPVAAELQQIVGAAKKSANLVRQLLMFSRKQQLNITLLDLRNAIEELLKMLQRVIGEDVRLDLDFAEDCRLIEADAGNIDQVVMNLAVNARDAMPEGGTLSLKTENVVIDKEYCRRNPEARPGRFVCLSISDTGTGIDKDLLPRIFEPFFTTREVGKGTGLGLSVVYGIIKSHKGWVNVYSESGQGTTFRLYFPASSKDPVAAAKENSLDVDAFLGHGEKILVVEDDAAIRELEITTLTRNGYIVTGVASAEEGLACIAGQENGFALVVSDVVLPGMNGVAFVEKLRETHPDLRVLLCSGYADQKSHWPLIKERGYHFLEKPFTISKLFEEVRAVLAARPA